MAKCVKCGSRIYGSASLQDDGPWCLRCFGVSPDSRPDDLEPITQAWCEREFGEFELAVTDSVVICVNYTDVLIELYQEYDYAYAPLPHIKTRRQFRALIAGLGQSTKVRDD